MTCFCLDRSSFEAALRKGDVAAALAHLQDDPLTTARTQFRSGSTLWHVVAAAGHLPLLQALAARLTAVWPTPAQPGPPDPHHHHSHDQHPQHQAAFHRRSHPFQRISDGLRGRGPDTSHLPLAAFVNTPNLLGQTALMLACRDGHALCVQFLLSMGANAWYRDRANCTALHYATLHDHGACIEAVLQHPASARPPAGTRQSLVRLVDLPNFCGYTAAHFAAVASKPGALAALMAGGANIAARCWAEGNDWISGPAGSTPLHLAARRGDVGLCKLMMSHYLEVLRDSGTPDPRLHADARGFRPYQRAAERGCRELAEMLMPSTPLSYIFDTDVVRLYKVPKLKALASAALQATLLGQINELEAEATERRRLATQAAVAAARAAAAAAAGSGSAVGGAGGTAAADGSAGRPGTADSGAGVSRTSTLINGAFEFVRRQSLRPLSSLRRRLRTSGRWLSGAAAGAGAGGESSAELRCVSHESISAIGTPSERPGVYGGNGVQRTVSGVSGISGATPRQSGVLPPAALGSMSRAATAAVAAAAGAAGAAVEHGGLRAGSAAGGDSGCAPLLSLSCERSAPPRPTEAAAPASAGGHGQAPAPCSAAAAVLQAGAAPPQPAASRTMPSLPGGISPVRGSSLDSDHLPFLPSSWSPYPGQSTFGVDGAAAELSSTPTTLSVPATGLPACRSARYPEPGDPSVGAWAVRPPSAAIGGSDATASGIVAGGSPVGAPAPGVSTQMSYCPVSLPMQSAPPSPPPPLPTAAHPVASPFALPTVQAQPLGRSSGTPCGGSPRSCSTEGNGTAVVAAVAMTPSPPGGGLIYPSGCSPSRPPLLCALGLQPVREDQDGGGGGGGDGRNQGIGRLSKRASKYVAAEPYGSSGIAAAGVGGSVGCSGGLAHGMHGLGAAAAAAVATVVGRISGEHASGRTLTGGVGIGGGGDPAGGSPPLGTSFLLPGALGRETVSSVGVGLAGVSRPVSGRPQASGGSGTVANNAAATAAGGGGDGGAVASGVVIGSDTSEDYCGVCFERPAFLHIRPCQHTLCAECSREVTRMVETQPPLCPFCRGVVHGFGC